MLLDFLFRFILHILLLLNAFVKNFINFFFNYKALIFEFE